MNKTENFTHIDYGPGGLYIQVQNDLGFATFSILPDSPGVCSWQVVSDETGQTFRGSDPIRLGSLPSAFLKGRWTEC